MFACLHTLYFKVDTVWQMSLNYANKTQTQGLQWAQSLCTLAQLCLENAIHMPTEIGRCRTKKHMNVHSETFRWKMTSCVCEGGGLLCVFWICGRPYHLAEKTISHLQGRAFNCYMARIQHASMCWVQKGLCLCTTFLEPCPAQSLETKLDN